MIFPSDVSLWVLPARNVKCDTCTTVHRGLHLWKWEVILWFSASDINTKIYTVHVYRSTIFSVHHDCICNVSKVSANRRDIYTSDFGTGPSWGLCFVRLHVTFVFNKLVLVSYSFSEVTLNKSILRSYWRYKRFQNFTSVQCHIDLLVW